MQDPNLKAEPANEQAIQEQATPTAGEALESAAQDKAMETNDSEEGAEAAEG